MYQLSAADQEPFVMTTPQGRLVRQTLKVGVYQTNVTILGNLDTREAVVIDPGDEAERIFRAAEKLGVEVKEIYHTHGHFDHILGSQHLKELTDANTVIHSGDLPWWQGLERQLKMLNIPSTQKNPPPPDRLLGPSPSSTSSTSSSSPSSASASASTSSRSISLKGLDGECLFTPGHSQGSTSYYFPAFGIVCTGDTLFKMNIGRTDLGDGSFELIEKSIREVLYKLPNDTKVIPGHGGTTSIGFEKSFNVYFQEHEGGVSPSETSALDPRKSLQKTVGFCCHDAGCSSHL